MPDTIENIMNIMMPAEHTPADRMWRALGFKRAHLFDPFPDEMEGFTEDYLRSNILVVLDWPDRLRVLLTGKITVAVATKTDVPVERAISVSAVGILPPTEEVPAQDIGNA